MIFIPLVLPKNECSQDTAKLVIESLFLEAKEKAINSGEAKIIFSKNEVIIQTPDDVRKQRVDFYPEAPAIMKSACSNKTDFPKQQTEFTFSSRGLKGISGAVYISCGGESIAFTVIAPTGGISSCLLKNGKWEPF